jgi:hypothetical protein
MGDKDDLEAAIDELYRAPLDRFTADRNALASALRKAGNRDGAERVKGLAKPGVTAWAVNQAWWQDQPTFRAMLESGEELRAAHLARARGKDVNVRQAADDRHRAVDAVVRAAIDALGGPDAVAPDVRFRILGTVESLASSGAPPDATIGRLVKDVQATGFEALSALAGITPSPAPPPPPRPVIVSRREEPRGKTSASRAAEKAEAEAREHKRRLDEAKARLADRERNLRAAKSDAAETAAAEKKARARLEKASLRTADLERQLEDARDQERAARQELAQAVRAASEAEMVEVRTARDVESAREALSAEEDREG